MLEQKIPKKKTCCYDLNHKIKEGSSVSSEQDLSNFHPHVKDRIYISLIIRREMFSRLLNTSRTKIKKTVTFC